MNRALLLLSVVALLVASLIGGSARASSSPTVIHWFGCARGGRTSGSTEVAAGTPFVFEWHWSVAHRGLVDAFLHDVTVTGTLTTTVAGTTTTTSLGDGDGYFSAPEPFLITQQTTSEWPLPWPWDKHYGALPLNGWATLWTYPSGGLVLGAGEKATLTLSASLSHPVFDGFYPVIPAGPLFPTISCTVVDG